MARVNRVSKPSTSKNVGHYVLDEAEHPRKKSSKRANDDSETSEGDGSGAATSEEDTVSEYEPERKKRPRKLRPTKRQRRRARPDESDSGGGSDHDRAEHKDGDGSGSDGSIGKNADKTLVGHDSPPVRQGEKKTIKRRAPKGLRSKARQAEIEKIRKRPLEEQYDINEEEESDVGSDDEDELSLDSGDEDAYVPTTKGSGRNGPGTSYLKRWRHMANEERHMLTARGGIIWQAARPMLAAMSEEDRAEAADVLKTLMRGLDAKLAATLIPGTRPMPRHNQDNPLTKAAAANAHAVQSSLMSWSIENQGILGDVDDETDEADATLRRLAGGPVGEESNDPDRTLTEDRTQPKGFRADILAVESMLVPEASEILALLRSLEEQDINLERAKQRLEAMKQNASRTDFKAIEAHERILVSLSSSLTLVHDSREPLPMGKAYEAAITDAARKSLAS